MNKEDQVLLLKAELSDTLSKMGSSLEEFEESLSKQADGGLETAKSLIGNLANGAFGASLIAGTTLGGIAYAANKHLSNQDKALDDKRQEVHRYKQLTDRIKTDYDIHG